METYTLSRSSALGKVFFGLALSLLAAFAGVYTGQYVPSGIMGPLLIAQFAMIVIAMFLQRRKRVGMAFVLTFTFISGITLWATIAHFVAVLGASLVLKALAVSVLSFFIAAGVASRTSFDFSFLGGFLFIGLIAILIMGLVSVFTGFSTQFHLLYSLLGIGVFIGYVLFDVNRIAHHGLSDDMIPLVVLSLYLDFLNLILFVLELLGVLEGARR
jgi:FtsH-binding integral membrane protein